MKTSTHSMLFALPFLIMAFGFSNKPQSVGDTTNIEINIGRGSDCFARGQLCNGGVVEMNISQIGPETDALGKAYFNSEGRFVVELNILLTGAITEELSDGIFSIEEDFQLPNGLLTLMGKPSDTVVLNNGDYAVEVMEGNSYRIVF